MAWKVVCKLLQRRSIDLLSRRHGLLIVITGLIIVIITVIQFSETLIEWSEDKYSAVFNSFTDNLGSRSYRTRLCLPVPIDVVYTWVNGSDPRLIQELQLYRNSLEKQIGDFNVVQVFDKCKFAHCVAGLGVVVRPAMPSSLSIEQIGMLYPALKSAKHHQTVDDPIANSNASAFFFEEEPEVLKALNETIVVDGATATIRRIYYTSDSLLKNSIASPDRLLMTGFPHQYDQERLLNELPEKFRSDITKLELFKDQGIALLTMQDSMKLELLSSMDNVTMNLKALTFLRASLVWDLNDYTINEDISASRFEDNEELRYSLRSIEKFAPWIRHVYIVTNGQIPSWLNLDNPRVTVVSHREIFLNQSHLPTFSSPAIESHLHRIKGVSDKFLYMNDDVFFGREVWPDDFFIPAGGQKVYLTWPVPNCQEGCPGSWIKDGYCDKACNNSDCEWDGGDCVGERGAVQPMYQFGNQAAGGYWSAQNAGDMYCSTGCANNWIADRYCDQSCNVVQCGFDAADCGTDSFHLLHGVDLNLEVDHYYCEGHAVVYFNFSTLVGELGTITDGNYDEHAIIRSVSIAQKFRVVTLVMFTNNSATELNFTLTGTDRRAEPFTYNFTVRVDTVRVAAVKKRNQTVVAEASAVNTTERAVIELVPSFIPSFKKKSPEAKTIPPLVESNYGPVNLSLYSLPEEIRNEHGKLIAQLETDDITDGGYKKKAHVLWQKYVDWLRANNGSFEFVSGQTLAAPVVESKVNDDSTVPVQAFRKKNSKTKEISNAGRVKETASKRAEVLSNDLKSNPNIAPNIVPNRENQREFLNPRIRKRDKKELVMNQNSTVKNIELKDSIFLKRKLLVMQESTDDSAEMEYANKPDTLSSYQDIGFLPWEKLGVFAELQSRLEKSTSDLYSSHWRGRSLLDTFASSLHHVSRTYNHYYGYSARKVPAHMPHMIDKNVMIHMQTLFPTEWDATSSHRIRSSTDMQFAFSYYYFLMSHPPNISIAEMFGGLDTDESGALSDREIRTLAAKLFTLPLDIDTLTSLEQMLINCSTNASEGLLTNRRTRKFEAASGATTGVSEVYYDQRMPQITLELVEQCGPLVDLMKKHNIAKTQYPFQIVGDDEVAFKMIRNNVSRVIGQLDDVRKHSKKFVCLNDNIDYAHDDTARTVKAVMHDFYESVLPKRSSFELPKEYRNKFLHVDELKSWWFYRRQLKLGMQVLVVVLTIFTVLSFVYDKIDALRRRIL